MQEIVKSSPMRKSDFQEVKGSSQKIECALDAGKMGTWFTAVLSSSGLTRPVRPVTPDRSDRSRPELLLDPSRSLQSPLFHSKSLVMIRSTRSKSKAHLLRSKIVFATLVEQKVI